VADILLVALAGDICLCQDAHQAAGRSAWMVSGVGVITSRIFFPM
jgi:hypothetical protein